MQKPTTPEKQLDRYSTFKQELDAKKRERLKESLKAINAPQNDWHDQQWGITSGS